METYNTDVLICGSGIAGLVMSKSLINLGLDVICLEKYNPQQKIKKEDDLRSTALLNPTVDFFNNLNFFKELTKHAQPMNSLIICNLNKKTNTIEASCEFFANELGMKTLGYNVPNKDIINTLKKILKTEKKFKFLNGDYVKYITQRSDVIISKTQEKKQIIAKLLIAADGRNSEIRDQIDINKIKYDYNQSALVFNIRHEYNHQCKSYEIYKSEGPCTLVPLKTKVENGFYSSVVLMLKNYEKNKELLKNQQLLSNFITNRTGKILGHCIVKSSINVFPIMSQASTVLASKRVILLAETAHVMPPIGAQGLNTSILDIRELTSLIEKTININNDIGNNQLLREYEKLRKKQIILKMLSVHFLNKLSISNKKLASDVRKFGLNFLNQNMSTKKIIMNFGMYQ